MQGSNIVTNYRVCDVPAQTKRAFSSHLFSASLSMRLHWLLEINHGGIFIPQKSEDAKS